MASQSMIAAQMYTLRDFTKTPADVAVTCAKVKKIGYDAIQVSAFGPIDPKELAKILHNEGLACCATHIGFERMQTEPEKVAEEHRLWGCKFAAIGGLPASYRNAAGYSQFAKDATAVGRKLQSLGITFGYHNHAFELEKFGDRTGLEIIYADSDAAAVTGEIDTYWIQYGGGDPAAWISRLKGRLPLLHLKDMAVRDNKPIMAEVGEGNLNWPAILAAAKEAAVQWYIIEQDVCERDPFESLAISLKNLRAMGIH